MPSPEHAADLERVLSRAVEECESTQGVWFGDGLPKAVRSAIEALGNTTDREPTELAFVEVSSVSPRGQAVADADLSALNCPVVGLSTAPLEDLGTLIGSSSETGIQLTRLICPVAVFDFTQDRLQVREVRHGLTAADLQQRLPTTLWAAPDLKELGTH